MRDIARSRELFAEALSVLPGGVDSPVRAFRAVGGDPLFIERAEGPYLFDVDGNCYIDYVLSWGPLILGHAHPRIVAALAEAASRGTSYGAPCEWEIDLARRVQSFMPSLEMIRFVNSGTEATMSALRLARAHTGRNKIVKFEGCYHGHADMLLVKSGSGVATLGLPDSPGVPPGTAADTLVADYNDLPSVERLFDTNRNGIAAVIVEPVAGNMGVVPPEDGFLQGLRDLTLREGALLIFDEVMSGFRVHPGGAQALCGVTPDLTTLGKVIGGGLPVGAYGGRRGIMQKVAPSGPVYQAGTLSGNPLAMRAGIETLDALSEQGVWEHLDRRAAALADGLAAVARETGVPVFVSRVGTMFTTFFTPTAPRDWSTVRQCDTSLFAEFFRQMLRRGVYLAPSQFEAGFLSTAHDDAVIGATLDTARTVFADLAAL
ncbi:MAG TPA: glutamate-1-semialdehyde 2,1-aminomutase [Anaerolineales bacterium]|nr:glutamate-1-semialdehyde 2,1-aminomutase [Anaerolineales bacterium]